MVTLTTVPTEVALPTELAQAVRSVQHPTASALVSLYQQRTSTSTLDGAGVPWRSDICFFNADDLVLASDNVEMDSFIGRIRIQWKRLSSSTDPMSIINVVVLVRSGGTWASLPIELIDEEMSISDVDEVLTLTYYDDSDKHWSLKELRQAFEKSIWACRCESVAVFLCGVLDLDSV